MTIDADALRGWLDLARSEQPLPRRCQAIYIGAFAGEVTYTLHFIGCTAFDAEDEDWACEDEESYLPANRHWATYVSTEVPWESVLASLVEAARQIRDDGGSILSEVAHVAVGFDDGELIVL